MPLANKIKYVGCVTLLSVDWLLWLLRLWEMQPHLLLCHPMSPGPVEIPCMSRGSVASLQPPPSGLQVP